MPITPFIPFLKFFDLLCNGPIILTDFRHDIRSRLALASQELLRANEIPSEKKNAEGIQE